jgi:hypothetical protein
VHKHKSKKKNRPIVAQQILKVVFTVFSGGLKIILIFVVLNKHKQLNHTSL